MKVRVYGEEEPKEKEIFLRLVEEEGVAVVRVVFKNGAPVVGGKLLTISENGVFRCAGVSPNIGLPLEVTSSRIRLF